MEVQANRMSMEDTMMAETEQVGAASNEGKPSVDMFNNLPSKRGRGKSQGSKKLRVCVTDLNLLDLVSGISNGRSTLPQRGRGRPKHTEQQGSGDDNANNNVETPTDKERPEGFKDSNEDSPQTESTTKKRGRPRKSLSKSTPEKADDAEELQNGEPDKPKAGRGRPKGSGKRKLETGEEDEGSSVTPRKRGRPKGSPNKKPRQETELSSEGEVEADGSLISRRKLRKVEKSNSGKFTQDTSNGISGTPHRGRGRPRKSTVPEGGDQQELVTDGSQSAKRGRGRPKGTLNKKPPAYKVSGKVGWPRRAQVPPARGKSESGRPRKQPAKRGRPRKYPLPSAEELKKPRVWKPLGRPRKYPLVDPPEVAPSAPRRSRGRPRKSESKKGAHLRKSLPSSPSSPRTPTSDGSHSKRGRPPSAPKNVDKTPRKRGRPKGSKAKTNSSAVVVEHEEEPEEEEVEHDSEKMAIKHGDDAEADAEAEAEVPIGQDESSDASNKA